MSKVDPLSLHTDTLAVIVELFVAKYRRNVQLVGVPELGEDLFDVVLVHAEHSHVQLGAGLAYEGAVGDIRVGGLALVAVDAVRVELVVSYQVDQHLSKALALDLFHTSEQSCGLDHWGWCIWISYHWLYINGLSLHWLVLGLGCRRLHSLHRLVLLGLWRRTLFNFLLDHTTGELGLLRCLRGFVKVNFDLSELLRVLRIVVQSLIHFD